MQNRPISMHSRISVIAALFAGISLFSCKGDAPGHSMKISFINGSVNVTSGNDTRSARVGDAVKAGDGIVTGAASVTDVLVGEEGLIRIRENTSIRTVSLLLKPGDTTRLAMDRGRMLVTLSKMEKGSFIVRTPTAVASVRGTSFRITCEKRTTRVDVLEGEVEVIPVRDDRELSDRGVTVATNQTVLIDDEIVGGPGREAKPPTPAILKEEDIIEIHTENADIDQERLEKIEKKSKSRRGLKSLFEKWKTRREKKQAGHVSGGYSPGYSYGSSGGGGGYYVSQAPRTQKRKGGTNLFTGCASTRK